jgi:hypothetical protein
MPLKMHNARAPRLLSIAEWIALVLAISFLVFALATRAHADQSPLVITGTAPAQISLDLGPMLSFMLTYFGPAILAALFAAITWLAHTWNKNHKFQITDADLDSLKSTMKAEAGKAILASPTNLAGVAITTSSPEVAKMVQAVQARAPDIIAKLGITPEWIADKVAGYLGEMQSNTTIVAAPGKALSL